MDANVNFDAPTAARNILAADLPLPLLDDGLSMRSGKLARHAKHLDRGQIQIELRGTNRGS